MAAIVERLKELVGWEEYEDGQTEETAEEVGVQGIDRVAKRSYVSGSNRKVVNMPGTGAKAAGNMRMIVTQPESIEDAEEICNHLRNKRVVVVNLEALDKAEAQRIIDFLSGAVHALDGSIQRVSMTSWIFVVAPCNVDVMGDFKEALRNKGMFSFLS